MTGAKHNWMLLFVLWLTVIPALAASEWDRPAADLADRIQAVLGPGQAQLTVRNLSTLPAAELTPIRHLLEADLRARGVAVSGAESANAVKVTLSENAIERLWVAEIVEGTLTQVVMTSAGAIHAEAAHDQSTVTLRATPLTLLNSSVSGASDSPILAALETDTGLIVLEPANIAYYAKTAAGYIYLGHADLPHSRPIPRDPRGLLIARADKSGFTAYLPGFACDGLYSIAPGEDLSHAAVHCKDSDDPWPLGAGPATSASASSSQRAFYNGIHNAYTGVLTPGYNIELAPFYAAAALPRSTQPNLPAMLVASVDGGVQLVSPGSRKTVSGARDWGSDLAVLAPTCTPDAPVLVSSSGEAASDSLRAYSIPAQEAVPISAPLAIDGAVTAIAPTADDSAAMVIVRHGDAQERGRYEVLRVAAICN